MANISTSAEEIISSACLAESTATLSLEVTNYLELKQGLNVADYVSSSRVFHVGGYDWEIRFYPQGIKKDCAGKASVSVHLWCVSQPAEDVGTKFTVSMLEKKSQAQVASFKEMKRVFTSPRYNLWGYDRFVNKSKLESLSQLGDGCFTVQCILTVVSRESPPPPPLEDLPGPHLERMLRDGIGTDVVFGVSGHEFRAHRSLLAARSPVFDVQLFGPTAAEKDVLMRVEVGDVEPDIFEMMLHYMYTDSLPGCQDEGGHHSVAAMQDLLGAASRYGLERLKLMCEYEMCKRIDKEETITTTLAKKKTAAAGDCGAVPEMKWLRNCTESTATISLEVRNYLKLIKGNGVVRSPVFKVGGYDWEIKFCPDGEKKAECEGNASCYLHYLSKAEDVSAKCSFSMILGGKGQQEEEVASHSVSERVFSSGPYTHATWGYAKFVDKAKLEALSRQGDGCFTVLCVLTVTNEIDETPQPPVELPGDLEGMLRDERGMDVTFSVCGQEYRARRFVLAARSPFFMAQLFGQMKEKDMRCLDVVDMVPCIFEKMLHYIYTGSLPRCEGKGAYSAAAMQHLLVAADRYGLDSLKLICEEELCKKLDNKIISSTLKLAEQHHCKRLEDACLEFVSKGLKTGSSSYGRRDSGAKGPVLRRRRNR